MKDESIHKILKLTADMQRFHDPGDKLGKIIAGAAKDDDELDIQDLEFVAAAGGMDYQSFLNKLKERES